MLPAVQQGEPLLADLLHLPSQLLKEVQQCLATGMCHQVLVALTYCASRQSQLSHKLFVKD